MPFICEQSVLEQHCDSNTSEENSFQWNPCKGSQIAECFLTVINDTLQAVLPTTSETSKRHLRANECHSATVSHLRVLTADRHNDTAFGHFPFRAVSVVFYV